MEQAPHGRTGRSGTFEPITKTFPADDFHLGAHVFSSDGRAVGTLESLLVGGDDYSLKALVVKEGREFSGLARSPESWLLADELIVPKDAVEDVAHDRIELNLAGADVRRLAPYLSYRHEGESVREEFTDMAEALLSNPAVPGWLGEVANKPAEQLEIEAGENVMLGRTGKKLGEVKGALFDGDDLVGVVLLPQGLLRKEVILPRRFLGRSDDAALFADLNDQDLEHLEPFKPSD